MITARIDNINYRVVHGKQLNLSEFATDTWCAIMKCSDWRVMYYDPRGEFSCNVFAKGTLNFFTNRFEPNFVKQKVSKLMKVPVENISVQVSNIVISIDLRSTVNIDRVFTRNTGTDIYETLDENGVNKNDEHDVMFLDRQSLPGLIIDVFEHENIGITLYSSGKLIAYGLRSRNDIERVTTYVQDTLIPLIENEELHATNSSKGG